jgi:hypothetical protein
MRLLTRGYGLAVLAATDWQSTFTPMACLRLRPPKVNGRKELILTRCLGLLPSFVVARAASTVDLIIVLVPRTQKPSSHQGPGPGYSSMMVVQLTATPLLNARLGRLQKAICEFE